MIICDIDGCLNKLHKRWISYDPEQDATNREIMRTAEPIPQVIALLQDLAKLGKYIVLITGRPARYKQETINWLLLHKVPSNEIHWRGEGDTRPDAEFKAGVLDAWMELPAIEFVIEDRDSVVAMWRARGLVCFQPFPGAF